MNFVFFLTADGYELCHECSYHTAERLNSHTIRRVYPRFHLASSMLSLSLVVDEDVGNNVFCAKLIVDNQGNTPVRISRADIGFVQHAEKLTLRYFQSDWGSEFSPCKKNITASFTYGSISGRSCKGYVPYAECETDEGTTAMALAWSGNWNCTVQPSEVPVVEGEKRFRCTMGLSDGVFFHDLPGKAQFVTPTVYLTFEKNREQACLKLRRHFRNYLSLLRDERFTELPVTYNTWWGYEDKEINEEVYCRDAKIARRLGCDYAILDAGWFGDSVDGQTWYEKRGDWENVNRKLFPSGLQSLCGNAKTLEIIPGIWCEIEAVGREARLNQTQEALIAKRDGKSLGYVCMGSQVSRNWAMGIIDRILGEYHAKWIKLDFNLDPGYGCNRSDHDHGAGDGLYAHYMGYYQMLDEIHVKYPDVVIENCSSGGLRNDIGMLSHTHFGFLSDPDFTEFHLQLFWGALSYVHQSSLYHFSWSDTTYCDHNIIRHPIAANTPLSKVDFILRAVMMGAFGLSYRLEEMPLSASERIARHCAFYKTYSTDFILNGDTYRLTEQPLAFGRGERFPAFEFVSQNQRAIVFFFRLRGGEECQTVRLQGLTADRIYSVRFEDSKKRSEATGAILMNEGLSVDGLCEEGSEIVIIE